MLRKLKSSKRDPEEKQTSQQTTEEHSFLRKYGLLILVISLILLIISGGLFFLLLNRNAAPRINNNDNNNNNNKNNDLCEDFQLIRGNSNPTEVKTFGIGEHHHHRGSVNKCLKELLKIKNITNPIIYTEIAPIGEVVSCDEVNIDAPKGAICKGWDDESSIINRHIAEYTVNYVQEFMKHIQILMESKAANLEEVLDQHVMGKITEFQTLLLANNLDLNIDTISLRPYKKTSFGEIALKSGLQLYYELARERFQMHKSYDEVISFITKKIRDLTRNKQKIFDSTIQKRNENLVKAMSERTEHIKIAIAGKMHFMPVHMSKASDEAAEYVQRELEKGKDGNPYAILASKQ